MSGPRVSTLQRRVPSPSTLFSFLRRFAIAFVVVVVLTAGVLVSADAYGKRKFAESHVVHIPPGILAPAKSGQPANYLLIGSDIRPADETPQEAQAYGTLKDVGPQHSDVMMVLHVDPAARTGMLVSFPRDLMVEIPGHGRNLLNSAFAFGGAPLVIQTLQQDFKPMQINHYLEVDFRGFKKIVDTIGHVHIWFPTPAHDPYTGLDVNQAGCVSLDGDQALAYARSRHYYVPQNLQNPAPWQWNYKTSTGGNGWFATGSDIDRIPRQQYFLRTVSQAAIDTSGSDPFAIRSLLGAVFASLGHDPYLKQSELNLLALTFRGLNPAKVEMSTLPNMPDPSNPNRVVVKYPDYVFVTNQLANFTPPKKTVVKPLAADKVNLRVVNGSGVKYAGSERARRVRRGRVPVGGTGRRRRPQRLPDPGSLRAGQVRGGLYRGRRRGDPESRRGRVGEEHARRRRAAHRRSRLRDTQASFRSRAAPGEPARGHDDHLGVGPDIEHDDHHRRAPHRRHPFRARGSEDRRRARRLSLEMTNRA